MKVTRTASAAFTAEFESEEELRLEHAANLSFNALALETSETVARDATLLVTLRGPLGGETFVRATVVAALPGRIALAIEGDSEEMLGRLLARSPHFLTAGPRQLDRSLGSSRRACFSGSCFRSARSFRMRRRRRHQRAGGR